MFLNIFDFCRMYEHVLECSRTLSNKVEKYSRMIQTELPEWSGIFSNLAKCTTMFWNVPESYNIFQENLNI